jgi:hypothetical protein
MIRKRSVLRVWSAVVLACWSVVAMSAADSGKPELKMFGNRPSPQGLWRMELLDASDPNLMANAKTLAETAVCMDAVMEMGKNVKPSASTCTQTVRKNTSAEAEIEKHCPDVGTTVMSMKRESKDTILFETVEKGKAGVTSMMRGRYHYVGPCSAGDSLMKADKDSEVCQRARAEAAAGPEASCAGLEGTQRAECVRQVEASLAASRKLCE